MEIISLGGEISRHNEQVLWSQVGPAINQRSGQILLDFSNVNYMAISSIAVLIDLLVLARRHSIEVVVCCLSDPIYELFKLSSLADHIEIYNGREDAIKHGLSSSRNNLN